MRKSATVATAGAKLIRIVSDAGVLKIDGRPGDSAARVDAVAIGSGRRVLSGIRLVATRVGDVITIRPVMPHRAFFVFGGSFFAAMDMSITLPPGIPIEITDGSGDIVARGVGLVKISDGSGGISVANVTGDLNVPDDGSGTLAAQRIGGSVKVGGKGSGALNVAHVGSDLIVGEKGSGLIRYEDVHGK